MTRLGRLLIAALVMIAGAAAAQPPVWRIAGKHGSVVLFGAIHLLPAGLDWRPAQLTEALARADELWFEVPIGGEADVAAADLMRARGALPLGDTLDAHLPDGLKQRLTIDAARLGLEFSALRGMRPWLADVTISLAADARAGALSSEGVERQINALAPPGVRREALETAAQQVDFLSDSPMAEQVADLGLTLDDLEQRPASYDRLVRSWLDGDAAALQALALDPLRAAAPRTYRRLITDRNRRWARIIEKRLASGRAVVMVVGIGHLIGPQGVPALLRARGFTVEGP